MVSVSPKYINYILLHLGYWIGVWLFFVYFFSYNSDNTAYILWLSSLLLPITMSASYYQAYHLIPAYLIKKRYKLYGLYSIYTLVAISYFTILIIFGSFLFLSDLEIQNMPPMSRNFVFVIVLVLFSVITTCSFSLVKNNINTISKNEALKTSILASQLKLKDQKLHELKSKIHPHFLFNTLNTIYGFSLKGSPETSEIILKLSNLLDYILYQVDKPLVKLEDELNHIQEYVDLEKFRFQETLSFVWDMTEVSPSDYIPPMIIIPLVENAFKHGGRVNRKLHIKFNLEVLTDSYYFMIQNTVDSQQENENKGRGIDLDILNKRLKLLYGQEYILNTSKTINNYIVTLSIPTKQSANE